MNRVSFKHSARCSGLLGVLLFFHFEMKAQYDTTTNLQDTTVTVAENLSPSKEKDSSSNKYFYKRWDTLTVEQRSIPADVKKKVDEDDDFWYANTDLKKSKREILEERERGRNGQKGKDDPAIRERKTRTPFSMKPWFQTLLWVIIVAGFTVFLVIYLGSSNIGLFRKKIRSTGHTEEDQISEDIFAINYQKEIDKAVAGGNYRLAVRLHFLQLLRKMSDSNIIRYKQDKTNFDYLMELQPTRYYAPFFRVTRNYEYSWYGQFPVSHDAYRIIKNDFEQLDHQLG